MTTQLAKAAQAAATEVGTVNGPEDKTHDWQSIDWRTVEDDVRRLRQRIFTASQAGDLAKVRNLQKLTAPRCALSYPRFSREEFEGRFLGPMPYLMPKGEGDHSMAANQWSCPGVRSDALGDPRGMAKA
jgi:hypothetical protein